MGGLKNISRVGLVVVLAISAFLGFQVQNVKFDYDFEKFFPEDDPETQFFFEHRERFETDNDFIFIALRKEEGVFNTDFLLKTRSFVDSLAQDPDVREVQSLTNMREAIKTPLSPMVMWRSYVDPEKPQNFESDSVRIYNRPELINRFISKKGDALLVYVKHTSNLAKKKCDALKERIDGLLDHYAFEDFKYAGRTIGMGYYVNKMQFETVQFIGISFMLVIVFLIFSFRSIWGVLVPLTIVTLSMLWIVGFMGLMGQPINLVLTVLPSIIFVVAMSDVIHLVSKYFDELRNGNTQFGAIKLAYREVGFATLLTSVTTSVGFLTLLSINMIPIRKFGLYTAAGVMFSFVLAYTLLPAILVLLKPPKVAFKATAKNIWFRFLHGSFIQVLRFRRSIFLGFVGIIAVSLVGLFMVESNYFLLEDLKKESQLRKDYDYFDQELMGLRPFEMAVIVKDDQKKITDYEVLCEMDKMEQYLRDEYGLKQTYSVVSALKLANRTEHGGQQAYYVLPDKEDSEQFLQTMKKYDKEGRLALFVDSTGEYGRISSTLGDVGLYEIRDRNEQLNDFMAENINQELVEFRVTGTAHLLDINMSSLSHKLALGLILAVFIVSVLMGFLYRSLKIVLIAIVPNILPMLMLSAILGFTGINLTVSTAVIFTISFGIAVDDTIHFMSKFKIEMNKGKSFLYALKRTYLSTGRAIILTTLILCSGFLLLMLSDFLGTFYIGLLISCTLFFALFADLFFLPVLMLYFYRKRK
ncbi:MAG: MMPL family transporter [Flavobacteriales bacterium]|nr:MMPL family transporter [Flavobacteriales bacterium]